MNKQIRRILLTVFFLAIMVCACTNGKNREIVDTQTTQYLNDGSSVELINTPTPTLASTKFPQPSSTPRIALYPTASQVDIGRIAFEEFPPGVIRLINIDGTGLKSITSDTTAQYNYPSWSPDGSKLAFSRSDWEFTDLYVLDDNNGELRRLTSHPHSETQPVWSPDGSKIAFQSILVQTPPEYYLIVIDSDGLNRTVVANLTSDDYISFLKYRFNWSPDSSWLAYSSYTYDGKQQIFIVKADGTGARQVTLSSDSVTSRTPLWLPDGVHIIYDGEGGIRKVSTKNGDDVILIPGEELGIPKLSPGGEKIAVRSGINNEDVLIYHISTGNYNRLSLDRPYIDFEWSPDGSKLAFIGFASEIDTWGIYIADLDTQLIEILTEFAPGPTPKISWQP